MPAAQALLRDPVQLWVEAQGGCGQVIVVGGAVSPPPPSSETVAVNPSLRASRVSLAVVCDPPNSILVVQVSSFAGNSQCMELTWPTEVGQVLHTGSQQLHHHHIVVPLCAAPLDGGDVNCTKNCPL